MKSIFRKKFTKIIIIVALVATGITVWSFGPGDKYFEIAKNLDIFAAVFRDLNAYYVDDIKPDELMQTGISAMTESLDPYTYYYSEDDLDDLRFQTTGKYGGVGAAIRRIDSSTIVAEVYENSPMEKAGVKAGDIMVSLDGKAVDQLSQEQISDLLRGEPHSELKMVVKNPITEKLASKVIHRDEIDIKSVAYSGFINKKIGYIKMLQFTQYSSKEVADAFQALKKQSPQLGGIILDLRSNPGGLLDEAVKTANIFVPEGKEIVSTRGKVKDWNRHYTTSQSALDDSIPLAILVNNMSASASEIVAGAVQDLDRGLIIGQRSFGKGLVQTTRNLPYNTKIKITTAKYYTPSGRCIQAIDYSHHNENGNASYFPDSLRKIFHTSAGRTVKDEGGIEPDVKTKPQYLSKIAATLLSKNYIFNFATRYYYNHPKAPEENNFELNDTIYNTFQQYLSGKDYNYETQSEKALEAFKHIAKKEKYFASLQQDYQALKKKISEEKDHDLSRHKDEIKGLLEQEILSRYYLQEGRIAADVKHDPEVEEAAKMLEDQPRYDSLLNITVHN